MSAFAIDMSGMPPDAARCGPEVGDVYKKDGGPDGGWLPIVLCPTDGVDRLLRLTDGREVVGCFESGLLRRNTWKVRTVAYHNPARIIGQHGGVDQWSAAYDTYLISELPDGVLPTHFRPNDTVYGKPEVVAEEDDGPVIEGKTP